MKPKDKTVAILGLTGMAAIAAGLGGALGWPFALLAIGVFAILVSMAAA